MTSPGRSFFGLSYVIFFRLNARTAHGLVSAHTRSTHSDMPSVRKCGGGDELALSYRFPRAAVPRGGAWAGLQVALLHVKWLVQHIAVVVIEPLAVGPLADNQASPPSSPAGLGALAEANTQC